GSSPRTAARWRRGWAWSLTTRRGRRRPRGRWRRRREGEPRRRGGAGRGRLRCVGRALSRAGGGRGGRRMSVRTETWQEGEAPVGALPRNEGTELMLDWVQAARVNRSAVERRASTLTTRRSIKKQWQAAWLLKAITLIDLTTLAGDDTPGRVRRLCAKALNPVREDLLEALGVADLGITVGAVCVYHEMVPVAVQALRGSGVPV